MCTTGYWYAGRDCILLCNLHGLATQGFAFGTRLHRSSLKTVRRTVFPTLRPSQGSSPIIRITHKTRMCLMGYWYAGRDCILLCNLLGLATQSFAFGTRLHRSSLKTVRCTVFPTLRPSQGSSPIIRITHKTRMCLMGYWYAGRDSNPRPTGS